MKGDDTQELEVEKHKKKNLKKEEIWRAGVKTGSRSSLWTTAAEMPGSMTGVVGSK